MMRFFMKAVSAVMALAVTCSAATADNVYTSPQPHHLEYEYDYKGAKTKFVSDLWLVIDQEGKDTYTVKLTGWAYIRQRNAGKKLWEDKTWTPFKVSGQVRNGTISGSREVGIEGAKIKTTITVSFSNQKATHDVSLTVGGRSYKLLSTTVNVRVPRP